MGPRRAPVISDRLSEAASAFAADRFEDSRRILKPIVAEVPDLPEARELLGLTFYRLGKWREAITQLEAFSKLTGASTEQHPVLADCYRAIGRHAKVAELWEELREASPSGELVNEGRIVAAGSLADQGRLADGLALLAKGFNFPGDPREHHLRRAYALADLYERTGDVPQARRLFERVREADPDFVDVGDRLGALG